MAGITFPGEKPVSIKTKTSNRQFRMNMGGIIKSTKRNKPQLRHNVCCKRRCSIIKTAQSVARIKNRSEENHADVTRDVVFSYVKPCQRKWGTSSGGGFLLKSDTWKPNRSCMILNRKNKLSGFILKKWTTENQSARGQPLVGKKYRDSNLKTIFEQKSARSKKNLKMTETPFTTEYKNQKI